MSLVPYESETEVEIVDQEVDLSTATLDELAVIINDEHHEVQKFYVGSLPHARRSGLTLIEVYSRMTPAQWRLWVDENLSVSVTTSRIYMRIARNWHVVQSMEFESISLALTHMRYSESFDIRGRRLKEVPAALMAEARELRSGGTSWKGIADTTGLHRDVIRNRLDPGWATRNRDALRRRAHQKVAAAKALAEKERNEENARLAKVHGGEVEKAYGYLRQYLDSIHKVHANAEPGAASDEARAAQAQGFKAEEHLMTLLRLKRQGQ